MTIYSPPHHLHRAAKQEAEELYNQNFLTTPDEQPAVPTFTESAKLRWAASVQVRSEFVLVYMRALVVVCLVVCESSI